MKKSILTLTIILSLVGIALIGNPMNASAIVMIHDTTIVDFSDFSVENDTSLISTTINDLNISMINNNAPGTKDTETIFSGFGSRSTVFDFNLSISVSYNYNATAMGHFEFGLGSYFFYNGTYDEDTHSEDRLICSAILWDSWDVPGGKYSLRAAPNGISESQDTAFGTMPSNNTLEFNISRNNNVLNITISSWSGIEHTYEWVMGLPWAFSYFYIGLECDPTYVDYTQIFLSNLNCELYIEAPDPTTTTPTNVSGINCGIICFIAVISINAVFVLRRKRKV